MRRDKASLPTGEKSHQQEKSGLGAGHGLFEGLSPEEQIKQGMLMTAYEYNVVPAPERGDKAKGAKTASERFSLALTDELNRMAADGWEYLRAEILPSEERSGLTGRVTVYHNMLVFRRLVSVQPNVSAPSLTPPAQAEPTPVAQVATSEGDQAVKVEEPVQVAAKAATASSDKMMADQD